MLDIVGKLFERIISARLEAATQQAGDLSDNQFGFRKGRSTIDAIDRVVSLAKNAVSGSRCTKRMCAFIGLDVWMDLIRPGGIKSCWPWKTQRYHCIFEGLSRAT